VQAKLKNAVLLQIDVTANSDEDKALLKRLNYSDRLPSCFLMPKGASRTAAE